MPPKDHFMKTRQLDVLQISYVYIRKVEKFNVARMNFGGPGCRLQTCSWLALEWFDSTFRANFYLLNRQKLIFTSENNLIKNK